MAMFENFPYTDLHNLNLDWIIKIAKDFLDQYTHIQQLISDGETSLQNLTEEGLEQLQEKSDNLESLLQEWYNEHSEDIAQQLQDAISDLNDWYTIHQDYLNDTLAQNIATFNAAADEKAAQTLESIPADYTTLSNDVNKLKQNNKALDYSTTILNVTSGASHSSLNDQIKIPITNGEHITIIPISQDMPDIMVMEIYTYNNEVGTSYGHYNITPNEPIEITANVDADSIGFYWAASWAQNSGSFYMLAYNDSSIFGRLDSIENLTYKNIAFSTDATDWHSGTIDADGQNSGSSSLRIRTNGYFPINNIKSIHMEVDPDYYAQLFYYEIDNTFIESMNGWKTSGDYDVPVNAAKFRISMRRVDNTAINTSAPALGILTLGDNTNILDFVYRIPHFSYDSDDITSSSDNLTLIKTKYAQLLLNTHKNSDNFMFFTDPHPYYISDSEKIEKFYATIAKAFNQLPAEFLLSGGDWLTDSMTPIKACEELGYITEVMNKMAYGKYYTMLGNHDMNIFGEGDDPELPIGAIINTMFPYHKNAYYKFTARNTTFFVIDTGSDHDHNLSDYRINQLKWLASELTSEQADHIAILEHIYCGSTITNVYDMASYVNEIIAAFNAKTTYTIDGVTYSFAGTIGRIEFILAGHSHLDLSGYANGVLVVVCNRAFTETVIRFYMVVANYNTRTLKLLDYNTNNITTYNFDSN